MFPSAGHPKKWVFSQSDLKGYLSLMTRAESSGKSAKLKGGGLFHEARLPQMQGVGP